MATFTIKAAEADLETLVDRASAGEVIEIGSPSGGRVRIVPLTSEEQARLAGAPVD